MRKRYRVKRTFIGTGNVQIMEGALIEPPALYRDYLIRRGLLENVPVDENAVLTAAIEQAPTAAIDPPKRRRGRPPGSRNKPKVQ